MTRQRKLRADYGKPRGKRALRLSKLDAAWLAGLFDGEGSIIITRRHLSEELMVTVTMCCREVIEEIQRLTGVGVVTEIDYESGRYTNYGLNRRNQFRWKIYGMNAAYILFQISSRLIEKKEKAAEAIMIYDLQPHWKEMIACR